MRASVGNHIFWKHASKLFARNKGELYQDITRLIQFSWVLFLFLAGFHLFNFHDFHKSEMIAPLWPMKPFTGISVFTLSLVIYLGMFATFLWGAIKSTRVQRVLAFVIYFMFVAFDNSFGKINHVLYLPLTILFMYCFLPISGEKHYKEKTILTWSTTLFFIVLSYTLTGLWKLLWGFIQLFQGEVSLFQPLSFRNLLVWHFEIKEATILGTWLLDHYVMGWLFYLVVVALEIAGVLVFFKPKWHKPYGAAIILMHMGLAMALGVNAFTAAMVVGLFLVLSPFVDAK